jgi:hypothetical protein
MKFIRTALVLTSFVVFAASSASAQVVPERVTFTTSFPFVAAGRTLPAGTYTIASVGNTPGVMAISSSRRELVLLEVDAAARPNHADRVADDEIAFSRLDNGTYAISEVWDEADQSGMQIAWTAQRVAGEPTTVITTAAGVVKLPLRPDR